MNTDLLSKLRNRIDDIDSHLIDTLASRMDVVNEIGQIKREVGIPAKDDNRWHEVVEKAKREAREKGISETLVDEIFAAIHRAALEIETRNT